MSFVLICVCPQSFFSSVAISSSGVRTQILKKTIPRINIIEIMPTPILILPVICEAAPTTVVPTNEAPFPQISSKK